MNKEKELSKIAMDRSRDLGSRQQLPASSSQQSNKSSSSGSSDASVEEYDSPVIDSAAVRNVVHAMGGHAMGVLLDARGRRELRDGCSERLQEEHGVNVQYAEQAVLANLDWGIDGLEKAVKATNPEIRAARLEHTEKMLQVAVLLDPKRATAGVPNSYLSAWANFYVALVWKLRNNDRNVALYLLDMFLLEPSHARKTFAPALWEQLFRPHMANIEAWYKSELAQITSDSSSSPLSTGRIFPIPKLSKSRANSQDSSAHSRSFSKSHEEFADYASNSASPTTKDEAALAVVEQQLEDKDSNPSAPSLAPDQIMRRELLNKLYQDSLDENTKQYAQYYKDWMAYDAAEYTSDSMHTSPALPKTIDPPRSSSFSGLQETTGPASGRSSVPAASAPNGPQMPVGGVVQVLQKDVAVPRQLSVDSDLDSFSEASFKDAPGYSRHTSMEETLLIQEMVEEPLEDVIEKGHGGPVDKGTGSGDHKVFDSKTGEEEGTEDEDGTSLVEFDKGAGVYLDGEQLSEDELLQLWEEISEGRIGLQDANDFLSRLTDDKSQGLDFNKLSEVVDSVRARRRDNQERQQPVENYSSPESGSPCSKYSNSPRSDIEEEEEAEVKIRQEFDRPDSPDTLSRMNSQLSQSSRSNIFQQKLYPRGHLIRPPKDFVCSITNQLFQDPVTIETGQTYERKAIREWLERANTTCPITRQPLKSLKLPKTNYVLKRLVDNWKDNHPEYFREVPRGEAFTQTSAGRFGRGGGLELEVFEGSSSPRVYPSRASILNDELQRTSRRFGQKVAPLPVVSGTHISPASLEDMLRQLRSALDVLFRTEDLSQSERAVLVAARVWEDSKGDAAVTLSLSRLGVVPRLMEVLSSSKKDEILRAIVCLLSDLVSRDDFTRNTILRADPEVQSIISVLKTTRVPQAAVLLHLLRVPATQVSVLKVVPFLVSVLKNGQLFREATFSLCISPKAAAVYILEQLVTTLDHRTNMANAQAIVSAEGVPSLMERLETKILEEKISAVAVLWSCLQSDGGCRMLMVQNLKMSTLVNLLHNSKEQARTVAIFFLAELIRLNRRRVIEKVLKDVLNEGFLNSMHILMLHLQMSPLEHRPLLASLLLQLDLLAEPQKHSVYREEAVEAIVDALSSEDNAKVQLEAAKALASLSGRYSSTGKPMTEASLLKTAGLEDDYKHPLKSDQGSSRTELDQGWEEEESAADEWDQRMALALLGSGRSLIEALGGAISSKSPKLARPCVVATAWLTSSLRLMPDSNLISYARNCFLPSLVSILQKGRDAEGRVLACLSLHNLTADSVGLQQLTLFSKELVGPLRRLRRYTWTAKKMLEALATNPFMELNVEMWSHGEVGQLDATQNGETRALLYFNGYLYSGHADASIKIWAVKRRIPWMVQEVREHTRTVLCLTVLEEKCKLFSGSADKTVRIWLVQGEHMRCLQVIDVREAVHSVAVNSSFICVIPQGAGLKVIDAEGANPRLLNAHKHVQSITFGEEYIYCGCTDSSIQEIDPASGASMTIQSGMRSLRGKKAIYSIKLFSDHLFAGGTIVEGIAAKVWKVSTKSLVSSIATQIDVRVMAVSEDLIYLASNLPTGFVEVWLKETYQKVASFTVGSKISSLALVGETLYTGSADGKLRAWALI